jgi:hypothetical protein
MGYSTNRTSKYAKCITAACGAKLKNFKSNGKNRVTKRKAVMMQKSLWSGKSLCFLEELLIRIVRDKSTFYQCTMKIITE